MSRSKAIPIGSKFGRWTVLSFAPRDPSKNRSPGAWWNCRCECGTIKAVNGTLLRNGSSEQCLECRYKSVGAANRTHGQSSTDIYDIWAGMIRRCCDPEHEAFTNYGARGISVCNEWMNSIEAFISYMGPRPSKHHSIDRINNDGCYEPGNVKWSTKSEQVRNTRANNSIMFNGSKMILSDVAKLHGVHPDVAFTRVSRGWDPKAAATTPYNRKVKRTVTYAQVSI